jgi:hypothetical protein
MTWETILSATTGRPVAAASAVEIAQAGRAVVAEHIKRGCRDQSGLRHDVSPSLKG